MWTQYAIGAAIAIVAAFLARKSLIYIRAQEAAVIERAGKFHRCLQGGVRFLVPLYDRPRGLYWPTVEVGFDGKTRTVDRLGRRVDLREALFELRDVQSATADQVPFNLEVTMSAAITDPQRAVYSHNHLPRAVKEIAAGLVQQETSQLTAETLLKELPQATAKLQAAVGKKLAEYGLRVAALQVRSALPADDVRKAIENKIIAEASKAATVLAAEAAAEAALKEGQSKEKLEVSAAEAKRRAMALAAEAEADAIRKIAAAIDDPELARHALAIKYLDVLRHMADGANSKVVLIPYDAGISGDHLGLLPQLLGHTGASDAVEAGRTK